MAQLPRLRPFFSYYGGKYRAAKMYPAPRGPVVEPFAGSAGYSVYYGVEEATLLDLDEAVCGVWNYLIKAREADILSLPDILPGQSTDDLHVPQEARWLIGFWLNPGSASPKKTLSKWAAGAFGQAAASQLVWGGRVRRRLASQVSRIRKWQVIKGDYTLSPPSPTTFVDPPYQHMGKYYRHGSRGFDYGRLAEFCTSRPGRVIVCENAGADWLPFVELGDVKTAGGRREDRKGGGVSKEVVWIGGRE